MQTGIYALITFNVQGDLGSGLQVLVSRVLVASQVSPEHIVLLARRDTLLKLSQMVGINFPLRLFLPRTTDLYLPTVHRAVVRAPNRAKDQGIRGGLRRLPAL